MDLRSLRFFLAVAREKSFMGAAQALHHTQPNITRTIKALEDELGGPLFVRSARGAAMTPRGEALFKRASEILEMVEQTHRELSRPEEGEGVTGDVHLAAGETGHMDKIAAVMTRVLEANPGIRFHVHSANGEEVARRVDLGLCDLGLVFEPFNVTPYVHRRLPWEEKWGVLVRNDHPLASRAGVTAGDLVRHRLIVSSQMWENHVFEGWHGLGSDKLDIAASYNLVTTARQLMEAGAGVVLTFEGLVQPLENQRFVPLTPPLHAAPYLIRRRGAPVVAPVRVFLEALNALYDGPAA